jgi:hypothetical protein
MAAWMTLIVICAVAVPFYLRFVVALCREYRRLRQTPSERIELVKRETYESESRREDGATRRTLRIG